MKDEKSETRRAMRRVARDAMWDAVLRSCGKERPGEFYERRVSDEDKESLKRLESKDIEAEGWRLPPGRESNEQQDENGRADA